MMMLRNNVSGTVIESSTTAKQDKNDNYPNKRKTIGNPKRKTSSLIGIEKDEQDEAAPQLSGDEFRDFI